jgi:hypothetical protein
LSYSQRARADTVKHYLKDGIGDNEGQRSLLASSWFLLLIYLNTRTSCSDSPALSAPLSLTLSLLLSLSLSLSLLLLLLLSLSLSLSVGHLVQHRPLIRALNGCLLLVIVVIAISLEDCNQSHTVLLALAPPMRLLALSLQIHAILKQIVALLLSAS